MHKSLLMIWVSQPFDWGTLEAFNVCYYCLYTYSISSKINFNIAGFFGCKFIEIIKLSFFIYHMAYAVNAFLWQFLKACSLGQF